MMQKIFFRKSTIESGRQAIENMDRKYKGLLLLIFFETGPRLLLFLESPRH